MYKFFLAVFILFLTACDVSQLNNPYPETSGEESILYSSFSERPKHLDPAVSYSANENVFIGQIYEPPYQYHYLKRPYQLEPLTAVSMPVIEYYNKEGSKVEGGAINEVAYTDYTIEIRSGIQYQPHPAFIQSNRQLTLEQVEGINKLDDFSQQGTRELIAEDYVHQIKRLAHPKIQSPIAGVMKNYILGFDQFSKKVEKMDRPAIKGIPLTGVEVLSRYHYKVRIKGKYPQFKFWLAMPFFAPMPWEADVFYQQKGLNDKNITLDWFPIGTGPYFLAENNPNQRMVLTKNPNYRDDIYPSEGEVGDKEKGLLDATGKAIPFIDKVVYILEKENIPYWNKFLQGYFDASGISSNSFDQAVQITGSGGAQLTEAMKKQGIQLQTAVTPTIYYMGFNMLDNVVGGDSSRARKLRQAISIALDYEEYIAIFMNGRGVAPQGMLPPGMYGYQNGEAGMNPYVYDWIDGKYQRKSIDAAEKLMAEAGYANGVDSETGDALVLYYDSTSVGADGRPQMNWYRKQFEKLGIKLIIRPTDYNRFQDKMRNGSIQLFLMGWNADYPDPENFFFLLYGPNGKVKYGGENAVNYNSPVFNQLFEQMRNMDDSEQRFQIIQKLQDIIRKDAPWAFAFHPKSFSLYHSWYKNLKPNLMANNTLKYKGIDAKERAEKRELWNQAIFWPLILAFSFFILLLVPAVNAFRRKATQVVDGK